MKALTLLAAAALLSVPAAAFPVENETPEATPGGSPEAVGESPAAPDAAAQATAGSPAAPAAPSPEEGQPEAPASPPAVATPARPAASPDAAARAEVPQPLGRWVYAGQNGWVWIPWDPAYTWMPPDGSGAPYLYVYGPSWGWTWVSAPWLWGWGWGSVAYPYYGYGFGAGLHLAWYGGWYGRRWYGPAWHGPVWHGSRARPVQPGVRPAPRPARVGSQRR